MNDPVKSHILGPVQILLFTSGEKKKKTHTTDFLKFQGYEKHLIIFCVPLAFLQSLFPVVLFFGCSLAPPPESGQEKGKRDKTQIRQFYPSACQQVESTASPEVHRHFLAVLIKGLVGEEVTANGSNEIWGD